MVKLPTIPVIIRAFFATCLLLCIGYRIDLLATLPTVMDSFLTHSMILAYGLISDVITVSALTLLIILCQQSVMRFAPTLYRKKIITFIANCLLTLIIFIFALLLLINQHLYQSLFIGLNFTTLISYLSQPSVLFDYFKLAQLYEFILLVTCLALFLILKKLSNKHLKQLTLWIILPIYIVGIQYGASMVGKFYTQPFNRRAQVLYTNPVSAIALSFFNHFNQFNRAHTTISSAQQHSIQLIDPDFVTINPKPHTQSLPSSRWNIVVFVLESVGSQNLAKNMPQSMPFLASLAKQSWWLNNNYSTGNISAFSQFSMMSGLYPNSHPCHYEFQPHLNTPIITQWLDKSYDAFFVTASNDLYAAISTLKAFPEYDNADVIDPQQHHRFFRFLVNEPVAHQFFMQRLNRARQPFLAFYWSGAAHWPYNNYNKDKQLQDAKQRYQFNLSLLDQEIKHTYELLKRKQALDHTIFIVLGDHGELFGEHNTMVHGRTLFQEEIKTPILIYAPQLFKPATINTLTNTADLLPTLLDALHINYGAQLQGESLFDTSRKRHFAFSYGDQDAIAAINQHNDKMIISFGEGTCVTYHLNNDPHELTPLPCVDKQQQTAILKYRHLQGLLLSC